jgi:enoyl-CoA hydratase/carnithine racemase
MMKFPQYADSFRDIRMERRDGVVEMRLHSNGDSLLWNDVIHTELVEALYRVGQDAETRVVILTGAGDDFCPGPDPASFHFDGSVPPVALDRIYRDGKALMLNLLSIPVPMIAAVNGAAASHSELALLCDIVIASETASFSDPHLGFGIVPGDGIHIAYPLAFGMNRGRYLALTGKRVTAQQALAWGAVSEVVPSDGLRDRAWELALELAKRPILGLRYTRELLTREIQRQMQENLGLGLALEGFSSGYGAWGSTLHASRAEPGEK